MKKVVSPTVTTNNIKKYKGYYFKSNGVCYKLTQVGLAEYAFMSLVAVTSYAGGRHTSMEAAIEANISRGMVEIESMEDLLEFLQET